MARNTYQRRLEELQQGVLEMGDLVGRRYDTALEAAATGDPVLAREVIRGDHEVNQRYLDLESDCTDLLALQQPVAGDLRFITASFKIITDLERIGDLATNLAGYGDPAASGVHPALDVRDLGGEAGEMVADALTAYADDDSNASRVVAARDDDLDERCADASERVIRDLLREPPNDAALEASLDGVSRALLTVRDLERVGDHAVNIAARTVYMVETDDELIY